MSPKPPFHSNRIRYRGMPDVIRSFSSSDNAQDVEQVLTSLARIRKAQGLTQAAVAEKAGVRQSHISRIENLESHGVAFDTVLRYARAIGVEFKIVAISSTDEQG